MERMKRAPASTASGLLFGDVLRQVRRAAGLTQEELAEQARLSVRRLSDLERGVNRFPRRETVLALANALQLTDDDRARLFDAARRRSTNAAAPTAASPPVDPTLGEQASAAPAPAESQINVHGAPVTVATTAGFETPSVASAEPGAATTGTGQFQPSGQHGAVHIFMIADVRGYTRYTYEHGDEGGAQLAMRFAAIARAVVAAHGGQVVDLRGDEVLAVFTSARAALRAAVELQRQLNTAHPTLPHHAIPCGIGLDAGEPIPVEGGYRGLALNLAARLCSLAGPGEILASETVMGLARLVEGISYGDRGFASLKGFATPTRVIQVLPASAPAPVSPASPESAEVSARVHAGASEEPPLPPGGFLGARPEHQLVARDQESAALLAALDTVQDGTGRLMLLAGEPGVGKTRLAQEVTLAARERGFLVATGRCYAPQESVPYYPFLEALSYAYTAAPLPLRAELPQRWSEVARLLPDQNIHIAGAGAVQTGGGYDDQQRLFWHVTGFLQAAAEERPLALLLDDLHWADQASIALLQHLARHTRGHRILLLGTYRGEEIQPQHPLAKAARDLDREHLVQRITVQRFPKQGTAALLAAILGNGEVSDAVAALIHEPTEGNAFFAQEVLRALVERGDVTLVEGRWERREGVQLVVPENVRATIVERVSRLSLAAQELLAVASVLGQTFTFDDLLSTQLLALQATQSHPNSAPHETTEREATQETLLEETVGATLLLEAGSQSYTFSHALTQRALYEQLPSRRRGRLHRAAAETIERLPEQAHVRRVAEVAYHFQLAAEPARALPYTIQAGDQAEAVYANVEAERHYQTALELARLTGDQPHEGAALERLGLLHWWNTGDYGAAIEPLEQAVEAYREAGNREGEVRTAALLARAYVRCGRPGDGLALLKPLLEGLHQAQVASEHPAVQARLLTALADVHFHTGSYQDQLLAAEPAVDLWRATGDMRSLADALNLHGIALRLLGYWEDALRELHEVVSIAEGAERTGGLFAGAHACYHIGYAYLQSGDMEAAAAAIKHGAEIGERSGNASISTSARYQRGLQAFHSGDWGAARMFFDDAARKFEGKSYITRAYGPLGRGLLLAATGEVESGLGLLWEAVALAEQCQFKFILHRAQREIAEVELVIGRAAEVRAWLEPVVNEPGRPSENDITPLLPLLAWACIEVGDEAQAKLLLDWAAPQAEAQHHRLALLDVLRVRARLALRQQRWREADTMLDQALALCRAMPYPYAEAKALYCRGQVFAAMGKPEQAREHYLQTRAICLQLGEKLYLSQIERALAGGDTPDPSDTLAP